MAGPLTIQRLPRGLLDLLLMKGSGETPQQLAADVQASVDIGALYLVDKQEIVLNNTNVLAGTGFYGVGAPLTVPDRELWLVVNISAISNAMIAGDTVVGRCAITRAPTSAGWIEIGPANSATGAGQFSAGWDFAPYRLLRSGDSIGFFLNQRVAYASTISITATFYRLQI